MSFLLRSNAKFNVLNTYVHYTLAIDRDENVLPTILMSLHGLYANSESPIEFVH